MSSQDASHGGSTAAPARDGSRSLPPLCCPVCRAKLAVDADRIECPPCERADCPHSFPIRNGFPDLSVGNRFEDESSDELLDGEARNSTHTVVHYWIPKFRALTSNGTGEPRVLALGCGTGMEVDALRNAGFNCVGIDNGNRARVWEQRSHGDALFMANGMYIPFADATFDIAFCGCVFPHIGVEGDSFKVTPRYTEDRLDVAREMTRVVKPGGSILVSSPNRLFPLDLFHGRPIGSYRVPVNPPWRRFLLSRGDYWRLFREAGCCGPAVAQSIRDYWGFCRTGQTAKGRLISIPVKMLFALGSNELAPFLRATFLLPWIVVRITR